MVTTEVPVVEGSSPSGDLVLAPLMWRLAAVLALLSLAGLAVGAFLREPFMALGTRFVALGGPWGVALAFLVPDATALPIPPEPFSALALAGGIPFWQVVLFGSAGSIAGGMLAFGGARLVRRIPAVHRRLEARAEAYRALVVRYGVMAIAVGALTPLPYSLVSWAAGVLGMRFPTFVLVSLLRIPRVALYTLPMWLGLGGAA